MLDKCERGNKIAPLWHVCQLGAILLSLKHLSRNFIISTLFCCLSIEQFLIQLLNKNCYIIKYYVCVCTRFKSLGCSIWKNFPKNFFSLWGKQQCVASLTCTFFRILVHCVVPPLAGTSLSTTIGKQFSHKILIDKTR